MYEDYMREDFVQERIAQLRLQKNVSARDMSLSLGQNNSYINRIENKKALPSLQGLFNISASRRSNFLTTATRTPPSLRRWWRI